MEKMRSNRDVDIRTVATSTPAGPEPEGRQWESGPDAGHQHSCRDNGLPTPQPSERRRERGGPRVVLLHSRHLVP